MTDAMAKYCDSCHMWMIDWESWKRHKNGTWHKQACRANWARMVQTLAEEAQEKWIIDHLIAASLSKALSKFVAKYKPNIKALLSTLVLVQDDNTCRECKHPICDNCLALKKQVASSRS